MKTKTIQQTKFRRSQYSPEVYNFQYYMDNFYLEKSIQTLVDAMRALPLVPLKIRTQSRAIQNFERAARKFSRRQEIANNQTVGTFFRSLPL